MTMYVFFGKFTLGLVWRTDLNEESLGPGRLDRRLLR